MPVVTVLAGDTELDALKTQLEEAQVPLDDTDDTLEIHCADEETADFWVSRIELWGGEAQKTADPQPEEPAASE